jgi:hypothetical protein
VKALHRFVGMAASVALAGGLAGVGLLPSPSSAASAPAPVTQQYGLTSVSCPSSSYCEAVGQTQIRTTITALAESWNGTGWAAQATVHPPGASWYTFEAVACTSADYCVAVGYYTVAAGDRTLVETWNGAAWAIVPSPDVAGDASDVLTSVSCPTASSCTAVGGATGASPPWQTLAESWNGSAWTIATTPNVGTAENTLNSVSCPSPTYCSAVGTSFPGGQPETLDEVWSGGGWAVEATPDVSTSSALVGVTCTSASSCTAVGVASGAGGALVESWNGTTWSTMTTPTSVDGLSAVSCPTPSDCMAVGDGSLGEVWNGATWTIRRAMKPPNSKGSALSSVSCASATACMAVGYYYNPDKSLADLWNGRYWVRSPTRY